MDATTDVNESFTQKKQERFVSIDFARGLAIVIMLFLHITQRTLNIDGLLNTINDQAIINLLALVLIPFFGGLAGFFLIVSAAGNMISIFKDLRKGKSVRSLVLKQVFGGFLLLVFAMLCEGLIGYQGLFGNFLKHLNNPASTEWTVMLWRWNYFETIHTIAWCLIINGCVQGLLSLKGNWKNTKQLIITYALLAVAVVALTQPIWELVKVIVPNYPFGAYPSGNTLYLPWIGTESFWVILRAPFLNALSAPMEPLFPYLAVSFIGSIIGIILSKPKEEISKKFPRNMFLGGLAMFIGGLIGIGYSLISIMNAQGFDAAIDFYMLFINHRAWSPDYVIFDPSLYSIPPFAWVGQFLAVNGFSIMLLMFLLRAVEFRGKGKQFADNTKFIRRFGIVAFSNYNNQWIYFVVFCITSSIIYFTPYALLPWYGVFLTMILTYGIYYLILWLWEKAKYTGSLEWFIRTVTNNLIPARKDRFSKDAKWWQKGQVDVERSFYNADWIELGEVKEEKEDSKYAFRLSLIGLCSIIFIVLNIISLFISINARKKEGKNKQNTAALIISIIGCVFILVGIILGSIFKIGVLGLF
jgi:uncharacterized membrane protein